MCHPRWTLKPNRLRNAFEILAVPTKAIIYCMAKLMD
jgi:hypothetical protein